ncbi:unnamed protein product [Camellia sinensis]
MIQSGRVSNWTATAFHCQDSGAPRQAPMFTSLSLSAVCGFFSSDLAVFSVAGALLAIPVGIKRKSLAPLVFFGTTGTMLDIIMGISQCEREHAERQMKLLEEQNAAAMGALTETGTES